MKPETFNSKIQLIDGTEASVKTLVTEGQPNTYEVTGTLSESEREELLAWLKDVSLPKPAFVA